jgi:uncharacterized protein YdhG (YjbR/CyaY superfamily)
MKLNQPAPRNIEEYIAGFPAEVQELLQKIRTTIKKAAPDAQETISYKIPTFTLKDHYLIYFAAYKKHIGLYPVPRESPELNEEISPYQSGKGTVQFPLDKPIPYKLITKIVMYRMKENLARAAKEKEK